MDKKNPTYLLVDAEVLPDIFQKVVSAKELLSTGACSTVQQAATATGISRSAFYKYKEYVFPFYEMGKDRIITLFMELVDKPGIPVSYTHLDVYKRQPPVGSAAQNRLVLHGTLLIQRIINAELVALIKEAIATINSTP